MEKPALWTAVTGGNDMKATAIAVTLTGSISGTVIAHDVDCSRPTAAQDTEPTEIVQRSLSKVIDNTYYWQAMTRYVLEDNDGDMELATERLSQQLRGSFRNSLPPTESFWHKLLEHSLSEVDWDRLARELINREIADNREITER